MANDPINRPDIKAFNKGLDAAKKLDKNGNKISKRRGTSDGFMYSEKSGVKNIKGAKKYLKEKIPGKKRLD